jgi:hypothetical protein
MAWYRNSFTFLPLRKTNFWPFDMVSVVESSPQKYNKFVPARNKSQEQ